MKNSVTVMSKPACVQCTAVKRYLNQHDIPYTEVDMTEDDNALATAKSLGYLQAPVVLVGSGEAQTHFSGFDPGELAKLH